MHLFFLPKKAKEDATLILVSAAAPSITFIFYPAWLKNIPLCNDATHCNTVPFFLNDFYFVFRLNI